MGLGRGRCWVVQPTQRRSQATLLGLVELECPFTAPLADKMLGVGRPPGKGTTWQQAAPFGPGQSEEGGSPDSHQLLTLLDLRGSHTASHHRVGGSCGYSV